MAASLALMLLSRPAAAQDEPDPFSQARMRLGVVAVTPTVTLRNLGIDSNVFNEVENPKQDLTAIVGTGLDSWLRLGRSRVNLKATADYVHFATYAEERSVNASGRVQFDIPMRRLTPYVFAERWNTRERPGFEIDVRARRHEQTVGGGLKVRLGRRAQFDVAGNRMTTAFGDAEEFRGSSLREALNRASSTFTGTFRYNVTPLTAFVVAADRRQERFEYSTVRDADSLRILPGVEFQPFALVSGRAYVGYRRLDMRDGSVSDFGGVVASIDLAYVLRGATRFEVRAERDVAYSFEVVYPYYLLTGRSFTVRQRVGGGWDVLGSIGRQNLSYRALQQAGVDRDRTDAVSIYGMGVGYRLGSDTRVGVQADYHGRTSPLAPREYKGLRTGASVTYGF